MTGGGPRGKWRTVRLGALAQFRNGVNYTKQNFGRGMKVINVGDFQDYTCPRVADLGEINPDGVVSDAALLKANDIVLVRSNGNRQLIGRSLYIQAITEPLTHSAFTIRVRFTSDGVLPRFYAYALRSTVVRDALIARGGGTNISNLNQGILEALEVPLPPLPDQHHIASILSAYDDLIENNTRRIAILEEIARSLYREWFVHFRFPGHEKVKLVESPLGPIPAGWGVNSLKELSQLVMGQSPRSEFYNESGEGLPFHQGVTDFGDHFPADRIYCTVADRIAEKGDILFSVRAPVGRINLADKRIVIGRGLCAIRALVGPQSFILSQMKERFREEDAMGSGTIFKAVTKHDVEGIAFLMPPAALADEFGRHADALFGQIAILSRKNKNLRTTRDLLLPKLISGDVEVSQVSKGPLGATA